VTLTNTFAPVTARAVGGALGSAVRARRSIANLELQSYTVEVPTGATTLTATIGRTSDLGADLDLIVTGPRGGQSADGDSEESVTIANPPAGTYTVTVDGYAVPAGTTEYDYLDVFVSPGLGTLEVADTLAPRATGASWSATGSLAALQAAAEGRTLFGRVRAVTDGGVVIGGADVFVAGQPVP
jgi:hypothetical protein